MLQEAAEDLSKVSTVGIVNKICFSSLQNDKEGVLQLTGQATEYEGFWINFFTLVSSVVLDILHSFRVYFYIFSTRFECSFTSSPLVSSVFSAKLRQLDAAFDAFERSVRSM